jgi:hypothetical protein
MYRVPAALCGMLIGAATAHASSILTVPDPDADAPSVIALGTTEPPTLEGVPTAPDLAVEDEANPPRYQVGGSILAFGVEAIPAAPVEVASIDSVADEEPDEPSYSPMPFVIRGGVLGDAFSAPPAEEIELPEEAADEGEVTEPVEPSEPLEQPG